MTMKGISIIREVHFVVKYIETFLCLLSREFDRCCLRLAKYEF